MHFKGIDITNLNDCEVYDLVIERKIPTFPPGFWCSMPKDEGKKVAKILLKHLIEARLKLDKDAVIRNLSKEFILNNKLWTPCKLYFGKSAVKYLMELYPGQYKTFEFSKCRIPQSYWCKKENRIEAIKWLLDKKLEWSIDDTKERFNRNLLKEYGLATLMTYYHSSYDVINDIYPNAIYPWEFRHSSVSAKYWSVKENRVKAIRWLINDKLQLSHNEVISTLSINNFCENKLSTLIFKYYNKSISDAIIEAFGGEFMPWEFGYYRWNRKDAKIATQWLIYKLYNEEGKQPFEINYYDFQRNKLRTVIDKFYSSSPKKAIMDVIDR